ncbi:MAG: hypothetical protein ACYC65_12765 [Candidatus Limnocylindrales bacterium]
MARQFVVQLENHPGELAHLVKVFSTRGVTIQHVACVGAGPLQCMFVTTTDDDAARGVLRGLGHDFIEGEPIMVEIPDQPGSLGEISLKLAEAGVRVTGMIQAGRKPGVIEMAFCVDDEAKAREALGLHIEDCVGCSS